MGLEWQNRLIWSIIKEVNDEVLKEEHDDARVKDVRKRAKNITVTRENKDHFKVN